MTEEEIIFQVRQALKTARERQQAGDEWSSGYEVGKALGLLEGIEEDG